MALFHSEIIWRLNMVPKIIIFCKNCSEIDISFIIYREGKFVCKNCKRMIIAIRDGELYLYNGELSDDSFKIGDLMIRPGYYGYEFVSKSSGGTWWHIRINKRGRRYE